MRPVIHSTKHYVQISRSTVATSARNTEDIINSVNVTVANAVDEVVEGAVVKAVYFELWVLDAGTNGSNVVTIGKNVGSVNGPTFGEMIALGTYTEKKNIFFVHQGLTPNDGGDAPQNIIRGWIKIPKSKQRFGLGDSLHLSIANQSAQDLFYCGFATYKEYT